MKPAAVPHRSWARAMAISKRKHTTSEKCGTVEVKTAKYLISSHPICCMHSQAHSAVLTLVKYRRVERQKNHPWRNSEIGLLPLHFRIRLGSKKRRIYSCFNSHIIYRPPLNTSRRRFAVSKDKSGSIFSKARCVTIITEATARTGVYRAVWSHSVSLAASWRHG